MDPASRSFPTMTDQQPLIQFVTEKTSPSSDSPLSSRPDEKGYMRWIRTSRLSGLLLQLKALAIPFLLFLLPSFISSHIRRGKSAPSRPRSLTPRPTAYLDGIRGVAAFFVFLSHYSGTWSLQPSYGYGSVPNPDDPIDFELNPASPNNFLVQLPFIRIILCGRACVTLFFVISGYVLSIKPLTTIYKGQHDKAADGLAGAIFRRFPRLYFPIFLITGLIAVLRRTPLPWRESSTGLGIPYHGESAFDQFRNWYVEMRIFINPFRGDCGIARGATCPAPTYDGVLWTIPLEFRYSMFIFLFLLAFVRARRWIAVSTAVFIALWELEDGQPDVTLFLAGMLLAELSLNVPSDMPSKILRRLCRDYNLSYHDAHVIHHIVSWTAFMFALFLFSFPERGIFTTFGFHFLARHVPWWYGQSAEFTQLYWHTIGSILFIFVLMYSAPLQMPREAHHEKIHDNKLEVLYMHQEGEGEVSTEPLLQRIFTSRLAQYLGYISYTLYLCHGTVNHTVGTLYSEVGYQLWTTYEEVYPTLSSPEEQAKFLHHWRCEYYSLMARGFFWVIVLVVWMADILARAVDGPCVSATRRIAKWVEKNEQTDLRTG